MCPKMKNVDSLESGSTNPLFKYGPLQVPFFALLQTSYGSDLMLFSSSSSSGVSGFSHRRCGVPSPSPKSTMWM